MKLGSKFTTCFHADLVLEVSRQRNDDVIDMLDDVKALASALSTWSEHHHDNSDSGFDYELGDGTVVNSKRAFPALCELYQLDDNRPAVLDSFTNAVFYGIYDIAYQNAGKEA